MKKSILFLVVVFVFTACETGTRYDKNATVKNVSTNNYRGTVNQDIENILRDHEENEVVEETFEESVAHQSYIEVDSQEESFEGNSDQSFTGGRVSDGLNVNKIRVGQHNGYTRLVFDIYKGSYLSNTVGKYSAKYYERRDDITVLLEGYRNFSANLPSFSSSSVIEKLYFERYEDDSAFKFHIKLRQEVKVRIFALDKPARLVFDIKPI